MGSYVWESERVTVYWGNNYGWFVLKHYGGCNAISVKFKKVERVIKYLSEKERQRLGLTPLVILALVAAEDTDDDELKTRRESKS